MEDATPVLAPVIKDFLRLDHHTKVTLLRLTDTFLLAAPELLPVQEDPAVTSVVVRGNYRPACLRHKHISAALNTNLQKALLKSARMGHVTFEISSPVSGRPIKAQASLCFDDYHFAYRFVETETGLVFYIIAGYEVSQIYGMYIAQNNIMLCLDRHLELGRLFAEHLPFWLPEHLARHGLEFAEYLGRPIECITSALRAPPWTHIGHQLWNELTGIDRFLKQVESTERVEWAVPDGRRPVEFYGPIDDLFPRLRGLVRRGFSDADDVIRYAYANSRFVVRITDDFVSENLRGRVLQYAASVACVGDEPTRVLAPDALPRILLGLRVENLTTYQFQPRMVDGQTRGVMKARFRTDRVVGWVGLST